MLHEEDPRWRRRALEAMSRYSTRAAREALERFAQEASSSTEARIAEAALRRR
ncbi:MAG: hypothetical protein R3F34_17860 [Planctomycetota bacterium]